MPVLRVCKDSDTGAVPVGQVFALEEERMLIGRSSECQIQIVHDTVSRFHAVITQRDGRFYIGDSDSNNGTFLNGKAVGKGQEQELNDGDSINICELVLGFHTDQVILDASDESNADDAAPTIRAEDAGKKTHPGPFALTEEDGAVLGVIATDSDSTIRRAGLHPADKLRALLKVSNEIGKRLTLDSLLPSILDGLFNIFPQANIASISLLEIDSELTRTVAKSNPPSDEIDGGMPLSATVSQVVRSTGEAILSGDTSQDLLFDESESVRDSGINSLMCVPLVGDDVETLGLIQIGIKSSFVPFSHRDLDVLVNIASQVSLAIQKARLHQETLEHVREL